MKPPNPYSIMMKSRLLELVASGMDPDEAYLEAVRYGEQILAEVLEDMAVHYGRPAGDHG